MKISSLDYHLCCKQYEEGIERDDNF